MHRPATRPVAADSESAAAALRNGGTPASLVADGSGPPQTKNKQRKPGLRHRHGRRPTHDKCE
ncbi:MAG: hypothetical protein OJF61_001060 [Rhodanobacteraceae bacterium]|nr:MAG: hypothetical protein OJF61_001060 [Rhodanobacteraceae bacterium]